MKNKTGALLYIYKDARDTVKHFDVILSNFRKIAFGFNSTIVGSYAGGIFNTTLSKVLKENSLTIWLVALVFNYLLWSLEKHYHKYLMFVAQVAKNIESTLEIESEHRLSERLYYASTMKGPYFARFLYQVRRFFHIKYYDTIYLLPILCVNIFSYLYTPEKMVALNISLIFQIYFVLYLLSYDTEVERKLKKKTKMSGIERFIKMSAADVKRGICFAYRCFRRGVSQRAKSFIRINFSIYKNWERIKKKRTILRNISKPCISENHDGGKMLNRKESLGYWMLATNIVLALITAIYVIYTKDLAESAQKQVQLQLEQIKLDNRPSVFISGWGEFQKYKDMQTIRFTLKNVGKLPARFDKIDYKLIIRGKVINIESEDFSKPAVIFPQQENIHIDLPFPNELRLLIKDNMGCDIFFKFLYYSINDFNKQNQFSYSVKYSLRMKSPDSLNIDEYILQEINAT